MDINYENLQQSINECGKYILNCIKNQYRYSLTQEQLKNINSLLNTDFIIIEKPTKEDIELFSKRAGVTNPEDYSLEYIPTAHGGEIKADNKIHIYPYTKSFSTCKNNEEIVQACIDNVILHETFHYFIRPSLESEIAKNEFGHYITEGLVQYCAEEFAKNYRLGNLKSDYDKNVEFVKQLIGSFPDNLTISQINKIIFTYTPDELLNTVKNGKLMYQEYVDDIRFKEAISSLVTAMGINMGLSEDSKELKDSIRHYKEVDDIDTIFDELNKSIEFLFKNNMGMMDSYKLKLRNIISDKKLKREISQYEASMNSLLPIEEQVKKLKKSGKSNEEIKALLGSDSYIFDYVPDVLYHGSLESLEIINSYESTQKGSYVYATDNPVHALFFSIFRNSSIARAHIEERIDEDGNYKVKYCIDERIDDALNEILSNKNVTIHICSGEQFFKPQGEAYVGREWISKDGQSIVPTDKIQVNVKHFFECLEKQGLVEYDRYDKSKDWKTVIDMLGQNYPFGLETDRGENIQEFDLMYDKFIESNFPEQLDFSKQFREFAKSIMATDSKSENSSVTLEEERNYKLKHIKNTADSFLLAQKNETGKINWSVDMEKIEAFMNSSDSVKDVCKNVSK